MTLSCQRPLNLLRVLTRPGYSLYKFLKQRIETLELMLKEQAVRIEQVQAELKEATVKVRDIALKAIEGASGAAALTRVSEIALQQAKGRSEG